MRYRLLAVGRLKRGFYAAACAHYSARLAGYAQIEQVELKEGRGADADAVRDADAKALLAGADGRIVVLDETGTPWSSSGLAEHVSELEVRGESRLSLLVGGAEGHPAWLRSRAHEVWSLSPLTLPHELARVVLLEQLYRIETLRAGHPYHRG